MMFMYVYDLGAAVLTVLTGWTCLVRPLTWQALTGLGFLVASQTKAFLVISWNTGLQGPLS